MKRGDPVKNYYEKEAMENSLWGTLREVALADNILSLLPPMDAGLSIIDIGCGDGFLAHNLRKYSKKSAFFDLSFNRLKNVKSNTGQYRLVNGDIKSLPFADNSFDFVICSEVLEHIHGYRQALDELVRITRRLIIITVPHRQALVPIRCPQCNHKFHLSGHINYFTGNELAGVFLDKGFRSKIKCFHTIYSYNRLTLKLPRLIRIFFDGLLVFFSGLISFLKPNYVAITAEKRN